jgi:NAD(P)-dependent dehydrogenase (short-subunit alcohol dehydrogenase family)
MSTPRTEHPTPGLAGPLHGQLALVTGANSGLGLHLSGHLAARGARVLMACRDPAKGQAALQQLRAQQPQAQLDLLPLDLANLASVRRLAATVAQQHGRLDLLCNNAGVMALPRRTTHDGFEMQLGTNHLGHFALTGLLLPLLQRAPAARVLTVSSLAYRIGRIRFDDLHGERRYGKWPAYAQSKLANLMFALELARRLQARGLSGQLISTAAHPGYAVTNLQMVGPQMAGSALGQWLGTASMRLSNALLAQRAEVGVLPLLHAATAPGVGNGEFWGPEGFMQLHGQPQRIEPRGRALDAGVAAQLWAVSERLTGVAYLS